jgi:hypothetical protein
MYIRGCPIEKCYASKTDTDSKKGFYTMPRSPIATLRLPRLLLAAAVSICLVSQTAQAAPKYNNSLDWVPADAVFYSASLRMKEQVDIVAKSNAWQKIKNLPSVQMGWSLAQMGMMSQRQQVDGFLSDPENQELLEVVKDLFSQEFLVYGDHNSSDFLDVMLRTLNAIQYGSMMANAHGQHDENVSARIILNSLDAQRDRFNSPGVTFGFKLTDAKRAQNQLNRLEKHAQAAINNQPKLSGRLKRATIAGSDYLTLELDGSLVPWDQVPWKDLEETPGQYNDLKAKLLAMKVVVSLGVRGDYLLLSVGGTTAPLASLGTGKLLADEPEFKPLAKFANERLVGISFVSKGMLKALSDPKRELDQAVQIVEQVLPEAGLPPEMNERILKDARELMSELKGIIPEPGAQLQFSFLSPLGVEGYTHNWTVNNLEDGSKPLTLLEHVGGNPILAAVNRAKYSPQQYDALRKWVVKAYGYFEDLAVPKFKDKDKAQYNSIKEAALPLIKRLDKVTGEMLLPALADGQGGFVLDAKITSAHWFEDVPQNGRFMPMLEAAFVFGVSDAELLKKACAEYRAIADDAVEEVRKMHPNDVPPDFKLPQPESRTATDGTITWYKLPPNLPFDEQLLPNSGLNKTVAVMSLSPNTTERLLGTAPLVVTSGGPLADKSKPLSGAVVFNFANLMDAATPWIDLAVREMAAGAAEAGGNGLFLAENATLAKLAADDNPTTKMILDQVHTVIDVLKCFRTVEAATYLEDGVTVTHSLTVFKDVP